VRPVDSIPLQALSRVDGAKYQEVLVNVRRPRKVGTRGRRVAASPVAVFGFGEPVELVVFGGRGAAAVDHLGALAIGVVFVFDRPFVAAEHDHHILRGGGMLKPVVLSGGVATGTWSISKGRPEPAWFGRPAPNAGLDSETADIQRFLAS
jgi:hypothetical protein